MSIRNTGELVKQAREEGRAEATTEIRRLRAEVRRLRGWLRTLRLAAFYDGTMSAEWVREACNKALAGDKPKGRKP